MHIDITQVDKKEQIYDIVFFIEELNGKVKKGGRYLNCGYGIKNNLYEEMIDRFLEYLNEIITNEFK